MSRTNLKRRSDLRTHEGAPAKDIPLPAQLRRSVMSCMLWEDEFYENGTQIADRIAELVHKIEPQIVASIADAARNKAHLRHVSLLIARELLRHPQKDKIKVADTIVNVVQRADELAELLSIYWKDGKKPLPAQLKKGLARAFVKFDEYQLSKYNRDNAIKLRDVLFLVHPEPKNEEQAATWKKLADQTLGPADTWETNLSKGEGKKTEADKKEVWEKLLKEGKLGPMALIRNLRNFTESKVDPDLVRECLRSTKPERVLPFRFISAARHAPHFETDLEVMMLKCLRQREKLQGHTAVLVDVSGSMSQPVSGKSEITRMDAACGLAMLIREICDDISVFSFSTTTKVVPPRSGFALRDAIVNSQEHSSTMTGEAIEYAIRRATKPYERMIVITDEQSHDRIPNPQGKGWFINIASAQNGIGYGAWNHIDGFSEASVDFIQESERIIND